ncbi:hypothetical protein ONA91_33750 [Micromonospora sp. DR5-3]|uniref:hypothetical protein n=1 Tax=unclassified Micromonospora TaxID=2617518 RepID=UPI001CA353F0|nr:MULTISPECIES: hypothetical protein [unclassified Micromonospora]MCW3819418.1 hypothetical protein [Micromonospora sp. DR5-3]
MSYSNYDPDDHQHRLRPQPAAPSTQPTARIAYVDVHHDSDPPYTPPAAAYVQPPAPPYPAPAAAYAQTPASPYAPSAYTPPHHPAPPAPGQRHPRNTATIVARFTVGVTSGVAFIFALHIFFSLAKANQSNGFVEFVYVLAKVFVLGFGDVFTPNDAKVGLVLNYGLAALVYLVVGRLIARALRQ